MISHSLSNCLVLLTQSISIISSRRNGAAEARNAVMNELDGLLDHLTKDPAEVLILDRKGMSLVRIFRTGDFLGFMWIWLLHVYYTLFHAITFSSMVLHFCYIFVTLLLHVITCSFMLFHVIP